MADLDIMPPGLPGERPLERKRPGLLSRLFGKDEAPAAAAKPEFADVDIEEIKRKLGLHEDAPAPRAPDPEVFLPPAREAPRDEVLWRPEPETRAQERSAPQRIEERAPERVDIRDWTQDAATVTPVPAAKNISDKVSGKKTKGKEDLAVQEAAAAVWDATSMTTASATTPADNPWDADHTTGSARLTMDATSPTNVPLHHAAIETHLAPIDTVSGRIIEAARTVPLLALNEWDLQDKELHPSAYFILRNGQPIKSLKDLLEVIDYIDDSTFEHHVNEYRNDFATWIEDAIGEPGLAKEVRAATDRAGVIAALNGHAQDRAKAAADAQRKAQAHLRKSTQAIEKLKETHSQIDDLRAELERRTQELLGERKRAARLVKGALDKEVARQLAHEREALKSAVAQLASGKALYAQKIAQLETRSAAIDRRESAAQEKEARATQAAHKVAQERQRMASEKTELSQLQHDAARIRKEHEDTVARQARTEANIKDIAAREAALARHEETLRQREEKVAADLTAAHAQREALRQEKAAHAPREAEVTRKEADAAKTVADAQRRAKEALDQERASVARLREETKKLEAVRARIDRALAKTLKSKKKITTALELRKHLERELLGAKSAIVQERRALEDDGEHELVVQAIAQGAAGQPASDVAQDLGRIKDTGFTQRIAQARSALERKDLEEARKLYNELRESYAHVHETSPERSALYVAIRELYDDINLAMLG